MRNLFYLVILGVIGYFGFVIYQAYQQGVQEGMRSAPEVIMEDAGNLNETEDLPPVVDEAPVVVPPEVEADVVGEIVDEPLPMPDDPMITEGPIDAEPEVSPNIVDEGLEGDGPQ